MMLPTLFKHPHNALARLSADRRPNARPFLRVSLSLSLSLSLWIGGAWTAFAQVPAPATSQPLAPKAEVSRSDGEAPEVVMAFSDPQTEIKCTPNPVRVAQPVTCVVTITHPPQMTVKVTPPLGAETGQASLPVPREGGQLSTTRTFTLRTLEMDKPVRVKGVTVNWDAVGDQSGVVSIPPQKITISALTSSLNEPVTRTFKDPTGRGAEQDEEALTLARAAFWKRHGPPPLEELNWALLIALGLLCMGVVGIFIGWVVRMWIEVRRDKGPYVDPRPAHEIALAHLEALKGEHLIERGLMKAYYQRLSEIVRDYFGHRYKLLGVEMTSDEVRQAARELKLDEEVMMCLEDFLSDTDLVKFADFSPSEKALNDVTLRAYRIVDLTQRDDEPETAGVPDQGDPQDEEVRS